MPIGKSRKKKPAPGKTPRKTAKKKTTVKKASKPKTAKKKIVRKKAALKKVAVQKARKPKPAAKPVLETKSYSVEPGPPPQGIPPVEEPARNEIALGTVTHYYSHLGVAVIQINTGTLKIGDTIHILGHSTDITQTVESMEYEHRHVDQASAGQSVGLRVNDHTREHDIVYLIK
jgi:hypothetical protein